MYQDCDAAISDGFGDDDNNTGVCAEFDDVPNTNAAVDDAASISDGSSDAEADDHNDTEVSEFGSPDRFTLTNLIFF